MQVLRRTWAWFALVGVACWAMGCGDSTGPSGALLRIVTLVDDPDTAFAFIATPLVVRVFSESGQPVAGAGVLFSSTPSPAEAQDPRAPYLLVGQVSMPPSASEVTVVTDGDGHASVVLRRGPFTGTATLRIVVDAVATADTLSFAILPGAPTGVTFAPKDTALLVGGEYELHASVQDAYGNPVEASPQVTAVAPTVSLSGRTVRAAAIGRGFVLGRVGNRVDTAFVSVVPLGTLAFFGSVGCAATRQLTVVNTDGSNRQCQRGEATDNDLAPFWSPDGTRLVFHAGQSGLHLYTLAIDGIAQRLLTDDVGLTEELWPHFSRDGTWIYFTGRVAPTGGSTSEIWRVRADGTGAERVGPPAAAVDTHASPSPDGTQVVFVTDRMSFGSFQLAVLDVTTGAYQLLGVFGLTPRWSPSGDLIAFRTDGQVKVVQPDGTGERVLSADVSYYEPGLDWSPDGNFLVVAGGGRIALIEVTTATTLPLVFLEGLQPTWRP